VVDQLVEKMEKPALQSKKWLAFAVALAAMAALLVVAILYTANATLQNILGGGAVAISVVYVGGTAALETIVGAVVGRASG